MDYLCKTMEIANVNYADVLEKTILGFPSTEKLDLLFRPLSLADGDAAELTREKARNWDRNRHASWLRVYAIRLESNVYVVTGGAIKLTPAMQDRPHTLIELDKLNECRNYLKTNGVYDRDSFMDYINEEQTIDNEKQSDQVSEGTSEQHIFQI